MAFMFLHDAPTSMYSLTQNKKMITIYLMQETRQKAKVFGWMYAMIKVLWVPMRSDSLSKKNILVHTPSGNTSVRHCV